MSTAVPIHGHPGQLSGSLISQLSFQVQGSCWQREVQVTDVCDNTMLRWCKWPEGQLSALNVSCQPCASGRLTQISVVLAGLLR